MEQLTGLSDDLYQRTTSMRKSDGIASRAIVVKRSFKRAYLWASYAVHCVEGGKLITEGFLLYLGNSS